MPGARRNWQPCCQASPPSRLFRHTPPVAMSSVFFSAVRFTAASAPRWNWSTQIGAIAATTALLAVLSARVFAELPSIHPPQPKPMARVRGDADGGALQEPLQRFSLIPSQGLHKTLLLIGAEGFPPLLSNWATNWHRGASPRPCLRSIGRSVVHPAHAAAGRRVLLRCFGETLGTAAAQAKLMVLEHYLTEVP